MPEHLPQHVQQSLARARTFIEAVLRPLERQLTDRNAAILPGLRRQVREASQLAGFFGKTQPEAFGGQPADILELTALKETFAAADLRIADLVFGPGPGLLATATGVLRTEYLEPLLAGEKRGAFGFTEPDKAARPTWARFEQDRLLITGQKSFVTGGATADFICILVNVEDPAGAKLGTAMVVVDRKTPGLSIEREFRSMEGGSHVSIRLEQVAVPADHIIGELGEGMPRALQNIGEIRLGLSARATGMCLWVVLLVQAHLLAPHRSGEPLARREGVRLRFSEMLIEVYAARSSLYRTARLVASGDKSINEVIATKVFCTEVAGRVMDTALQLVGGEALIEGHPLERAYRSVRSMRLAEGASDLLRLNLAKGRLDLDQGRL